MTQRQLPGIKKFRKRAARRLRAPKKIRHVSFEVHRCRHGLVERVFSERWQQQNRIDSLDILNKLMPPGFVVTQRDASVAATVVQWLGTNIGSAFVQECLARVGERVVTDYQTRPENQYYIASCDQGTKTPSERVRLPSAWYNFAGRHAFHKLEPLSDYRLPTHDLVLARGNLIPEVTNLNARPKFFTEAVYRQQSGRTTTPLFRKLLAARTEMLASKTDAHIKVRLFDSAGVPLDSVTRNLATGKLPELSIHYRQFITAKRLTTAKETVTL